MIDGAAFGIALAALVAMMVDALLSYARLPDRVPLRFSFLGAPGLYGPKALFVAIFAAVALLTIAGPFLGASSAGAFRITRSPIVAATTLAFIAYTQHAIIDAVLRRNGRLAVGPFYVALAALIGVNIAAAQLP